MENMYSYQSQTMLAHDFGLLSLEDDDYLWLYGKRHAAHIFHKHPRITSRSSGYVDLDSPNKINIYASTFEDKDAIADAIERYNDSVSEDDKDRVHRYRRTADELHFHHYKCHQLKCSSPSSRSHLSSRRS